jgi:hypothetical protein
MMRKILFTFLLLTAVSRGFSQDEDSSSTSAIQTKYDYYEMRGEYMVHYFVEVKSDTLYNDIPLRKNVLTSKAELTDKKGKIKRFLNEGECVDANGKIIDCTKLQKRLEDELAKQ